MRFTAFLRPWPPLSSPRADVTSVTRATLCNTTAGVWAVGRVTCRWMASRTLSAEVEPHKTAVLPGCRARAQWTSCQTAPGVIAFRCLTRNALAGRLVCCVAPF